MRSSKLTSGQPVSARAHPKPLAAVQASLARSRSRTPARRGSSRSDAAQARLRRAGCRPEHALDHVAHQLRVLVLHAVGQHEVRDACAAACGRRARTSLEPARGSRPGRRRTVSPAAQGLGGHLARRQARADGEVHALEPDAGGQAQRGGVAGDEQPVARQLGHHALAALGDEVGGVLLQLAALDERRDGRVGLEPGDDLLGPALAARPAPAASARRRPASVSRLV